MMLFTIHKYTSAHEPLAGSNQLWSHLHFQNIQLSIKQAKRELVARATKTASTEEELTQMIIEIEQALELEQDRLCGKIF